MNEEHIINWLRRTWQFSALRLTSETDNTMTFEARVRSYDGPYIIIVTKSKYGGLQAHTIPTGE